MNSHQDENLGTVEQRLRFGPGLSEADHEPVFDALLSLNRHLSHWRPERIDLRLSVQQRGEPNQKVTLEVWLPGRHSLLASVSNRDFAHALVEVRKLAIRGIEEDADRR